MKPIFWKFLPFWLFLIFFKFGAGLHYSLISPLGEKVLPLWIVGILMGSCSVIQFLFDIPAGHLLDRYGYRKILKITTAVFLFAGVCYMFKFTVLSYVLSLLIAAVGWLFFGPGVNAYILSHAPRENSGKFISLRDVFGSIGIVLASAVLPFALLLPTLYIGLLIFGLVMLSLLLIFNSPKDYTSVHSEMKIETQHHYIKRHPLRETVKMISKLNPASGMLLLHDFTGTLFYGVIWFVVPLVIAHQANSGVLSIGLGMFDFAVVILGFLLGNLADRSNKRELVFFGLLLFAVAGMLIGFNFSWLFLVFGFLTTAGDEMSGISLWSWLHMLDRDHAHDGAVAGIINFAQDVGWAIGPMVAGFTYVKYGPTVTIVCAALPIFVTWIFYQYITHTTPRSILGAATKMLIPRKPHRSRNRI